MGAAVENDRIWEHFQTKRVDVFDRAHGRYVAMAASAKRRHGRDGGRVLNIGIGPGRLERILLRRGWRVASLDPSANALSAVADVEVDARCGYAQDMPFGDASFDVVIASEVLEHIAPSVREQVLTEIARVLTPGGWFIGSVPYREVLADYEVICPDCGKVFHRWGHVSSFDIPHLRLELARVFDSIACRRRAFVDWNHPRSPLRIAKSAIQALLGRWGAAVANPSIEFAARRPAHR